MAFGQVGALDWHVRVCDRGSLAFIALLKRAIFL